MNRVPQVTEGVEHRHAQALTEIKQMHADYLIMQTELMEARRRLDQQDNMISLLTIEKDRLNELSQVYMRKLVRLAAAMSGISRLAQDADEIMRSVQEFKDVQGERDLEEIFESLPTTTRDGGQQ
jgi:hypothetical protein